MPRNTTVWLILLTLLLLCSAGTASAMSAFSRKYKMQCDGCHTSRMPELNEFGIEFYKNGFVIPEKGVKAGTGGQGSGAAQAPAGTEKTAARPEGKGAAKEGAAKEEREDEEGEYEEPPPKKEVPPTVVYRSKSRDGTVFFTDTPERRTNFIWQQDDGEGEPVTRSERTVQPKRRKPAAGRQPPQRPAIQAGGVKAVERERFRNYEECMERQLVDAKQPESGQEMMDLMIAAEKRCAGYPLQKR